MLLSDAALKNRITIVVLVVVIVAAGVYSYVVLPRESAPDVPIPYIVITTIYEGVTPEDVESQVTNEIENELTGIKGVKEITSTSAEGVSTIVVEFYPDVDIEDALQRTKDKVDLAEAELPTDEQRHEPVVSEINVSEFPIVTINVSGEVSPVILKTIAEDMEDTIQGVPGVLEVDVVGALEREIRIEIDPDRLAAYGLTVTEVLSLIPTENLNVSAGGLETEGMKFDVRVPAEFDTPTQIDSLVLTERGGKPIYLTDVAAVHDTYKDRESYSRLDGVESVSVLVKKRVGANIVEVAGYVHAIVRAYQDAAPETVKLEITDDRSDDIRMIVLDLENNVLSGLVLVVLVLLLFLGFRTSMIVALAIPLSMLMSFTILNVLGITLNMVVLFSLILALGMLVDNAIVIVENIYRHMEMGYPRLEAAMKGTGEVAWPVITSCLTTIAAFTPMVFWPGIMGEFMKYLPITVIITLASSLFVALLINPVVTSIIGAAGRADKKKGPGRFMRAYRRVLETATQTALNNVLVLLTSVLVLLAALFLFGRFNAGVTLFPDEDPNRANVVLRAPQGTNIRDVNELARGVAERIERYRNDPQGNPIIEHVITKVGGASLWLDEAASSGPHIATLTLRFVDFEDRASTSQAAIERIREELRDVVGAEVKLAKQEAGPPTGAPVSVRLVGKDMKVLEDLNQQVTDRIVDVPNLVDLQSNLEAARPELRFQVDRERAKRLGVNTYVIGNFLKTAIFGTKVGSYRVYTDDYDITIRLPEADRTRIDDLLRLRVPNDRGKAVPLSSLGRFEYAPGLGTIHRVNQKRVVTLTADAEGRLSTDVLADVQDRLAAMELPAGYEIRYAGENEDQQEAMDFLLKAGLIALAAIAGILVTQFNTLSAPLIIMTTVVLSTIGVFIGLIVCQIPFGIIMTGVGVISLAGVVVNNAIVLLDYTRRLQRRGLDVREAAVEAGVTRLRPVLLTAVTTILGLVPMATGLSFDFHTFTLATRSESAQWWASMAIAVIFGLAFATMLTLVVVPALYTLTYRMLAALGMGGLRHTGEQAAVEKARLGTEMEDY